MDIFNNLCVYKTDIRGGTFTISCLYGGIITPQTLYIRGENPSEAAVEAVLAAPGSPWYAIPIAKHECGYSGGIYRQFNTTGTLGPNDEDYLACPNWGASPNTPGGWGIMQLDTPAPVAQELWDWEANVTDGLSRLEGKRVEAANWIARQEAQQAAEEPGMLLENEVFEFNGVAFQKGTGRTPIDACTIQGFNGADNWVIYWQNKTATNAGSWKINPEQCLYLNSVCGRID